MRTKLYYFVTIMFFSFNFLNAQVIGKIFDADYANKEFGKVENSISINNSELKSLLDEAGEYIMLNIDTGELRVLNGNRNSVKGNAKSDEEVFYKMSTSQVRKLLEKGGRGTTQVEMRPKTLTLTNGNYTMDLVWPCPPECF